MSDRIFPTTEQTGLGSAKEINTIDWLQVEAEIKNPTVKAAGLPDGLSAILAETTDDEKVATASEEVEQPTVDEDKETNQDKEPTGGKFTDAFDTAKKNIGPDKKIATSRNKKLHFSSASQISAEALREAQENGDEAVVKAILAVRQARRVKLASKIIESEKTIVTPAVTPVETPEVEKEVVAQNTKKGNEKMASKNTTGKVKISVSEGFKKVSAMNNSEQAAWAKYAEAQGFPKKYIEEMMNKTESVDIPSDLKEVMASELPMNTKKAALTGLIRTAELDSAQKARIIKYWVEDLGYGDPEWVKNWVNATY